MTNKTQQSVSHHFSIVKYIRNLAIFLCLIVLFISAVGLMINKLAHENMVSINNHAMQPALLASKIHQELAGVTSLLVKYDFQKNKLQKISDIADAIDTASKETEFEIKIDQDKKGIEKKISLEEEIQRKILDINEYREIMSKGSQNQVYQTSFKKWDKRWSLMEKVIDQKIKEKPESYEEAQIQTSKIEYEIGQQIKILKDLTKEILVDVETRLADSKRNAFIFLIILVVFSLSGLLVAILMSGKTLSRVRVLLGELKEIHQKLNIMINSLGQGLMIFDKEGSCSPVYTHACEDILGTSPAGKKIWDVFKLKANEKETFQTWIKTLFQGMLGFNDLLPLGKKEIKQGKLKDENFKFIDIKYFPVYDESDKLENIVTVATDLTDKYKADLKNKEHEKYIRMVLTLINNKDQFLLFIKDAKDIILALEKNMEEPSADQYEVYLKLLHSLKGISSLYSIARLEKLTHDFESLVIEVKGGRKVVNAAATFKKYIVAIKAEFQRFLKDCSNFLGKEVIDGERRLEVKVKDLKNFENELSDLQEQLRQKFNETFLKEPIINYFKGYDDLVKKTAQQLGKKVDSIEFNGGELKVYADEYLSFFSILVHVFKNCLAHGIETPAQRQEKGKSENGHIKVDFKIEAEQLYIIIQDDGDGINTEKVKSKIKEMNLSPNVDTLTDHEIHAFIFHPSFSTSQEADSISGRGVGMGAVKEIVEELEGEIIVDSKSGVGATFTFRVPVRPIPEEKLMMPPPPMS